MTKEQQRAVRFIVIGLLSTGLYFGLLILFRPLIASTFWLTAFCYGLAMCLNFLAQGFFTFEAKALSHRNLGRYIVMQGSALLLNSLAMALFVDRFGMPLLLSQVFVTGVITVMVYFVSKTWVYR